MYSWLQFYFLIFQENDNLQNDVDDISKGKAVDFHLQNDEEKK